VTAEDAAGNLSAPSNEASATVSTAPPLGLVAAYSFDQGSGSSLPDLSGNGNNGTIANASWSTGGKYGSALSFNGTNAIVNVPDSSSLDLTSGMTLEAWVNPSALGNAWRTVLMKEQSGNLVYDLYANGSGATKVPVGEVYVGGERTVAAPSALTVNTWTHLAVTYDGSVLALYRNGTQVATLLQSGPILTSTGALRIGGNTIWPEWFAGLIDEVRVYNRALTQTQIQADMNTPLGVVDTQPPSAPANLSASGSLSSVSLSWSASTDNVGVARYDLYRSTTPASPRPDQPDRPAERHQLHGHRAGGRQLLLQGAGRGRGRQPLRALERGQCLGHRRHHAAERAGQPRCQPRSGAGLAQLERLHRQRRRARYELYRSTTLRLHPRAGKPDRPADGHELQRQRPGGGHLLLQGASRGSRPAT
jgi:hypothetical protein